MSDLRDELKQLLDEAKWDWLMPHEERGRVIVVAGGLDLVEVGVAIANDNLSSVQHWISQCLIYKPSDEQKAVWSQDQAKRFDALIVQPYVLVQEQKG
ncbi:DUF2288 domain-containing protein [Myxacorys almedinensis]|uniref:DUF2288 family protein n=1 Tax=Myxacorys almedinensis A TaxID=2690445 RepID=A0A8J7Z1Q1_9CYAN|nr:DUF2288 domain-containing protein [Myxacorys almedinensis]NDJ16538.1 DUF2288 family protein [Myxacorys almedinensis A]